MPATSARPARLQPLASARRRNLVARISLALPTAWTVMVELSCPEPHVVNHGRCLLPSINNTEPGYSPVHASSVRRGTGVECQGDPSR